MVKWIYTVLLIVLSVMVFILRNKNAKRVGKYNCSNEIIKFFYGISIWIVDIYPKALLNDNNSVEEVIKKLSVKDRVAKEHKEYILEKIATVVLIVYAALALGTVAIFINEGSEYTKVLQRNDKGQGEAVYELEAIVNNETKKIEVIVPEKLYSQEEAMSILKECENTIQKEILGNNDSLDKVDSGLNLIASMHNGEVQVDWEISDDETIGYDGQIGEVADDGREVCLRATLTIQDYSLAKDIKINVFPMDQNAHIQEYVQEKIDGSDLSKKEVDLPLKVGGKNVKFVTKKDRTYEMIFPVALIIAVFIYFLKDRDLKKELEKRNVQMMADYPEIVSKLLLLTMTGMSVRRAFATIADTAGKKDRFAYSEICLMVANLQSGKSELKAYEEFGKRSGIYSYIRLMNIISQNIKRGSNEMGKALKVELEMALLEKKNSAIKIGEVAGTKLMAPMIILLIISLAIIATPALMSLQMK